MPTVVVLIITHYKKYRHHSFIRHSAWAQKRKKETSGSTKNVPVTLPTHNHKRTGSFHVTSAEDMILIREPQKKHS
jgi:hypothetical protein